MEKVFGIGLSKTGTTSLTQALRTLGYTVAHCPTKMMHVQRGVLGIDASYARSVDAIVDGPPQRFYRELDASYPRSRFILTVREEGSWAASAQAHFTRLRSALRPYVLGKAATRCLKELYGSDVFDAQWTDRMHRHNATAQEYFAARPCQLLVMDICAGDGWERLCTFLERDIPRIRFPYENRTDDPLHNIPHGAMRDFALRK